MDINVEWENFLKYDRLIDTTKPLNPREELKVPKCGSLYISTKTKITYLDREMNLYDIFWKLPILEYHIEDEGMIKKQMKIILYTKEELEELEGFLQREYYYQVFNISSSKKNVVSHTTDIYAQMNSMICTTSAEQYVNTPIYKKKQETHTNNGDMNNRDAITEQKVYSSTKGPITQTRKKKNFKDIKKISVGMCKKDIISKKSKEKSAFYNCVVIIMRVKFQEIYREVHIKMFNTGKLEIPGVKEDALLFQTLDLLIRFLKMIPGNETITYKRDEMQNVLINSNFNCGFNIDRERLYYLLKNKYNIKSSFDTCSYPGIQCEFYYKVDMDSYFVQTGELPPFLEARPNKNKNKDKDNEMQSCKEEYTKVSFMIFRTGSVLMVGKCGENVIKYIYGFLKDLLYKEFYEINHGINIDKSKKELKEIILPICYDIDDELEEENEHDVGVDFIDEPNIKDYKKLNFVRNNYRVILDKS